MENKEIIQNTSTPTGSIPTEISHIVTVPVDRYEVQVRLSTTGEFLGIESIKVNQSFLDYMTKIKNIDVMDVDSYYPEEL